ncbi:pyridoxamine 5'-phosphate oxidase family protein, partial [Leuconostoc mesenteroides]|uniref:pyridoxamine 5'-phosphate oxidase family protein n=1 Tax=Leuconostoc mesenteroides TaxID=1245 RepID=UPI0023615175
MALLSEEMKKMIDQQLPFLATTGGDGSPQVGPKGSTRVYDDEHLIYYEHGRLQELTEHCKLLK